jgi:hypothetical protein
MVNPDCYGCIVECLCADRVELWDAKCDRDKGDSGTAAIEIGYGYENLLRWNRPRTNRSACDAQGDGNSYLNSDKIIRGSEKVKRESELRTVDGGRGRESHRTTEIGKRTRLAHEPQFVTTGSPPFALLACYCDATKQEPSTPQPANRTDA